MANQQPRTLVVTTNHFRILNLPTESFYQYNVSIKYKEERTPSKRIEKGVAREVFLTLQANEPQLFTPRAIYDGMSIAFSTNMHIHANTFEVVLGRTVFIVAISPVTTIQAADIQALVTPRNPQLPRGDNLAAITLLQHIVRQAPNLSVRPAVGQLLVNVDVSTVAVYQSGGLVELVMAFLDVSDARKMIEQMSHQRTFDSVSRFLKGLLLAKPKVNSPGNWTHGKKISGLVANAGQETFVDQNNVTLSVESYFAAKYNYQLRLPGCFGVKIGRTAVFPAEVCMVMPGQLYKKRLDEDQQRKFIQSATQKPSDRLHDIGQAVFGRNQVFNYNKADFLGKMRIQTEPEQVEGKLLPNTQLKFGRGQTKAIQYGKWNVVQYEYAEPKAITNFAVISFVPGSLNRDVKPFVKALLEVMRSRGVSLSKVDFNQVIMKECSPAQIKQELIKLYEELKATRKPEFILVVLPFSAADLKRTVKYWSNAMVGIPTQCVRDKKYNTQKGLKLDQYCNNVALKINAKIGGVNSMVSSSSLNLNNLSTMIVGCDVSHPGPGAQKPSVASLVASMDQEVTKYASFARVQTPRLEMILEIKEMFTDALKEHVSYHNRGKEPEKWVYPLQHIIVYRDGVSEGEYEKLRSEIAQIHECLRTYPSAKTPKLTFIVVTKRHHVRFFISDSLAKQDTNLKNNAPAGLVVDEGVVDDQYPNFFLLSHSGLQGTSCPSHYIVLENQYGIPKTE
ncbi:hypothetical protein EUX98_g245 [Antrodiella citrinella]|uniref:Piwi domain-containing protein n=1 Tax=Antrodiella citrinella TaxID=2447956 RepID=A0A4V3XJP9_9APHY|nr:hypothetical protein EUX98_g245 [Antrodiella citrinella]